MKLPNDSNQLKNSVAIGIDDNGNVISSIDAYNDDAELTKLEKKAIKIIKTAFDENDVPFNISFRRRSKDYLTLLIHDPERDYYNDFCRIKAGTQSTWVSLDVDKVSNLAEDIRFVNVVHKECRHWKIKLNCIDDFEKITDLIIADYQLITKFSDYSFVPKKEPEDEYTSHYIHKKGNNLHCFVDDYVLFDLETTDKNIYKAKIIEIAAIKVRNNEIVEKFDRLVNPKMEIPTEITELTGITNDMISGALTIDEILPEFLDFIENDVLVGHNINAYDINIINIYSNEKLSVSVLNDFVDTLELARHISELDVPNYKLKTLCEFWGIKNDNAHRAYSDVLANNECYQRMKGYTIRLCGSPYVNKNNKKSNFITKVNIKGKTVCLTGEFDVGTREQVIDRITELGGIVKKNVIKSLDYLIIGNKGSEDYKEGTLGGKYENAVKWNERGANIAIVREKDFIKLEGIEE